MTPPVRPPRVSVVLPVYNSAATLGRCWESLNAQTFGDWECLAVDDGSTDGSGAWLERVARTDSRLRVLRRGHEGLVSALNAGLAEARGEFVARMDADDVCLPRRFEAQVGRLDVEPSLGLVGCRVAFAGDGVAARGYALHVEWLNGLVEPGDVEREQFVESPFAHPSVVFRRVLVERHGAYRDGDFPEDYDLWMRWLAAGVRMAKVPEVLLRWHDGSTRLSRVDARYAPEAFYRLKAGYLARWLRRHVSPERLIVIWGAGRLTRRRVDFLRGEGVRVGAYLDVAPARQGWHRDGRVVWDPGDARLDPSVFVIGYVANRGARELQRQHLLGRGFVEGRDFLFAA